MKILGRYYSHSNSYRKGPQVVDLTTLFGSFTLREYLNALIVA